ncbi:terminus macrodomain insulation protein YfbV [Aliidiomarina sanyensis]|uniref:UPF0208 membrane protein YfbV n=1 Tax=Aliidiomarina sanyensis TaxID=1249555 RepID=A0A432WNB7_9GAMM|nr:terminus macrodomain insulation protein YfbV [Aliidiomarina sanyensis]RUO35187.1 DUF412 domain-containing protein [Aliidiomarina sanyensis]
MWKILRHGREYMKTWPNHAIVGNLPEAQIIPATRWALKLLPAAAVVNFFVQFQYLGSDYLIQIVAASLFLLVLPLQGYYWLGKRAYTMLPPPLKHWYFELKEKLNNSGEDIRLPGHRKGPCYIDLARVLRKALAVLPPEEQ